MTTQTTTPNSIARMLATVFEAVYTPEAATKKLAELEMALEEGCMHLEMAGQDNPPTNRSDQRAMDRQLTLADGLAEALYDVQATKKRAAKRAAMAARVVIVTVTNIYKDIAGQRELVLDRETCYLANIKNHGGSTVAVVDIAGHEIALSPMQYRLQDAAEKATAASNDFDARG